MSTQSDSTLNATAEAPDKGVVCDALVRLLWLLRPLDGLPNNDNPWEPWYDKAFGFVVCAESEQAARQLAHTEAGDENRGEFLDGKIADTKTPWLDAKYSTCAELTSAHAAGVVMRDFASA